MTFCELDIESTLPEPKELPKQLISIGDHLRARRILLELAQEDVARLLNVSTDTITGWENNRTEPQIQFMPRIRNFLGYLPMQFDGSTLAGIVKTMRIIKGMSQRKLGKFLNIDPSTIENIENKRHNPSKQIQKIILGHYKKISLEKGI